MYRVTKRSRSRDTGTTVEVIDNRAGEFDLGGSPWITLCDDHGMYVGHPTRHLANYHSAMPSGWCEVCGGTVEADA